MQVALTVDPVRCPLCGEPNQCALEVERASGVKQPVCWCSQVKFEAVLLSRLPEGSRGKACVCHACAMAERT